MLRRYIWNLAPSEHIVDAGVECVALELGGLSVASILHSELPRSVRAAIAMRMVTVVEELHEMDLVHGDIHPGNWLIRHPTDPKSLKLIDFGRSAEADPDKIEKDIRHLRACLIDVLERGRLTVDSASQAAAMKIGSDAGPAGPYDQFRQILAPLLYV